MFFLERYRIFTSGFYPKQFLHVKELAARFLEIFQFSKIQFKFVSSKR